MFVLGGAWRLWLPPVSAFRLAIRPRLVAKQQSGFFVEESLVAAFLGLRLDDLFSARRRRGEVRHDSLGPVFDELHKISIVFQLFLELEVLLEFLLPSSLLQLFVLQPQSDHLLFQLLGEGL